VVPALNASLQYCPKMGISGPVGLFGSGWKQSLCAPVTWTPSGRRPVPSAGDPMQARAWAPTSGAMLFPKACAKYVLD
jgi:hypothetical protein